MGAFWLSRQLVVLSALTIGRLGNGVIYGDSIWSAIAFGLVGSLGRTACAVLGAVIVTLSAQSRRPKRWAWVVALLYILFAAPRVHYRVAPTTWDSVARVADILWPAVFCVVTAMLIAFRKRKPSQASEPNVAQ